MWNLSKQKGKGGAGRLGRRDFAALAVSMVIVLFVLNFLASRHFLRVDITEGQEYALSNSTKDILKNLDDLVNIRIYFSKDLPPALVSLKRDVDDIISEYETYAGGKLKVQYIDPQESQQQETQVRMMGIPPVQLNVIQKDKQELVKLYLGMAVVHEDRQEVIPVVQGVGNLEYDLTAAILEVSRKVRPTIRWFTNVKEAGFDQIKEQLKQRYTITDVSPEKMDLSDTDALLVVAIGEDLSDQQLFAIDQYLMKGGKVFAMVDRVSIGKNLEVMPLQIPNVISWLSHNGIDVMDKFLVDRSNTHAAFSGGYVTYHVPYPYWVRVGASGFNKDSPAVSDLDSLILPWVSPLELGAEKPNGVEYTVWALSSPFNRAVGFESSLMPEESQGLLGGAESHPKPLAIFASGSLKSYFVEEGKVPPIKGAEVAASADGAQLVVVGETRFIQDNFLRQFRANTIFFENAVDFMAMGNQLIGIRSKGFADRPIGEMSPAGIAVAKYSNVLGAPIILVIVGIVILLLRRQRQRALKSAYR